MRFSPWFFPPHSYCRVLPSPTAGTWLFCEVTVLGPSQPGPYEAGKAYGKHEEATWYRELEHPLRQGEARMVCIVERGTDMTGLPAEEERVKKWCQKKLLNWNSLLSSEVNCILPLHVWLLMGWVSFFLIILRMLIIQQPKKLLFFFLCFPFYWTM